MRLSARGLTKQYGGTVVLRGVDLDVASGEIRALVGENGAGKSTLIKILSGAVTADRGEVRIDDERLPSGRPLAIRERGLSVVYQEFTLVPDLTVAENVFLGRELGRPLLGRAAMRTRAQSLLDELGVSVDAREPVRSLSVAHQQMVAVRVVEITVDTGGHFRAQFLGKHLVTQALCFRDFVRRARKRQCQLGGRALAQPGLFKGVFQHRPSSVIDLTLAG